MKSKPAFFMTLGIAGIDSCTGIASAELVHSKIRCENNMLPEDDKLSNAGRELSATDRSLMLRYRKGDQDAATELYVRYARKLQSLADNQVSRKLALHVDPDSIVQSVFRTFFRRASQGQYDVANGDDLWKLLLVIALNKIRTRANFYRADKRDVARTNSLERVIHGTPAGNGEQDMAFVVLKLTVDELTAEMPDNQRDIVLLRIEGFEVAEIAQRTGRSKRSVERILQTFRNRLAQLLESDS